MSLISFLYRSDLIMRDHAWDIFTIRFGSECKNPCHRFLFYYKTGLILPCQRFCWESIPPFFNDCVRSGIWILISSIFQWLCYNWNLNLDFLHFLVILLELEFESWIPPFSSDCVRSRIWILISSFFQQSC